MDNSAANELDRLWEITNTDKSSFVSGALAMALQVNHSSHSIVAQLDPDNEDMLPIILKDDVNSEIERWDGPQISFNPASSDTYKSQVMTEAIMNQLHLMRAACKEASFPTDDLRDRVAAIAVKLIPLLNQAHSPSSLVAQLSEDLRNSPLNLLILSMGAAHQSL